jgi:hypothetical protein
MSKGTGWKDFLIIYGFQFLFEKAKPVNSNKPTNGIGQRWVKGADLLIYFVKMNWTGNS